MILVKPQFQTINEPDYLDCLKVIEWAGRICYKSKSDFDSESGEKFVKMIIKNGHHSVLEHVNFTVHMVVDRGVSHELVRHRLAAYSQESTRYCNYKGGVTFVIPPWVDIKPCKLKRGYMPKCDQTSIEDWLWAKSLVEAEDKYLQLVGCKWSPQQARSVLPNSTKTEIVMTANIREWRHILALRTSLKAHPQMREIMLMVLDYFKGNYPVFFEDINYD